MHAPRNVARHARNMVGVRCPHEMTVSIVFRRLRSDASRDIPRIADERWHCREQVPIEGPLVIDETITVWDEELMG